MASQGVAAEQNHVDDKHQASHADAEMAVKPKTSPRVRGEDDEEGQGDVKEITMKILEGQGKECSPRKQLRGSPTVQEGGSAQKAL